MVTLDQNRDAIDQLINKKSFGHHRHNKLLIFILIQMHHFDPDR